VLAIIGILAAIAISNFSGYRQGAYDADAMSVLHNITITQEAYFTDHNTYTDNIGVLRSDYNLYIGDIVVVMIGGSDSYLAEAGHPSSPNWYEMDGPGGTITKQ